MFERKKNNDRNALTKHVPLKNHDLVIANFGILKSLKGYKTIQELPFFGKFVTEVLIYGSK